MQEFFEDTAATLSTITGLPTTLENADSDKDDGSDSDGSSDSEVIFDVHLSPLEEEEEHESQGSGTSSDSSDDADDSGENVEVVDLDAVADDLARGVHGSGGGALALKAVPQRLMQVSHKRLI